MIKLTGNIIQEKKLIGGLNNKSKKLNGKMKESSGGVNYYEQLPDKPQINNVKLVGNKTLDELNIQSKDGYASKEDAGVVKVGKNLEIDENGALNVLTTNDASEDNTTPITSAGVYIQLGNINALLEKI